MPPFGEERTKMNSNEERPEEEPEDEPCLIFPEDDEAPPLMGVVGELTESAAQQLSMALLGFNGGKILATPEDLQETDDIEFFISSAGGSVNEMFTVYDMMGIVKANRDIATFGYGKIYSAAVLLLASGTKGKRYVGKNTRLMIHHCSANAGGSHPDVRCSFNELKKLEGMMIQALADNCNLSVGEIYNMMSDNTDAFFSAEEALEMGIVDKII